MAKHCSFYIKIYIFSYFPPMNRNIIIGRYSLADIHLNDKLLSKIHCVINYSEKEGWTLIDGHDGKPSTNGTWLYINEDFEMYDKMIFKSNQTIFQVISTNSNTIDI
jgi:hypothetical protein